MQRAQRTCSLVYARVLTAHPRTRAHTRTHTQIIAHASECGRFGTLMSSHRPVGTPGRSRNAKTTVVAVAAANLLHFIGGLLHDELGLDFEPPLVRAVLEARERDDLQCVPTTDTMAYNRDDMAHAACCMVHFACCT